jgi:hypothetical protein
VSVATTLTASVAPTDTTISVADGSISRSEAFPIAINGEQMDVIDGFGTSTWTVQRDEVNQSAIITEDLFDRVVNGAWGTTNDGHQWQNAIDGSSRVFSVTGGQAVIEDSNVTGTGIAPRLPTVPVQLNSELRLRFIVDSLADTNDMDLEIRPRELDNPTHDRYELRIAIEVSTDIEFRMFRRVNGVDLAQGALITHAGLFAVDTWYVARMQAYGSYPTTLNAKVWKESDGEPAGWDVTDVDDHPTLQVPGYPAMLWALGSGATNAPVTVGFADLQYLRVPTGGTHASGSSVVLIEAWPLPIAVNTEAGVPLTAPPSGALQGQTDVQPPVLWTRIGDAWYPIRAGDPSFVSVAKWGNT